MRHLYLEINKEFTEEEEKYTVLSPAEYHDCTGDFIYNDRYVICYNLENEEILNLLDKPDINGYEDLPSNVGGQIYGVTLSQTGNCLVAQSCYLRGNITIEDNAQILNNTRIEFSNVEKPEVIIKDNAKLIQYRMEGGGALGLDCNRNNKNSILILDNTVLTKSRCLFNKGTTSLLVYSGTTEINNIEIYIYGRDPAKICFYNTYIQNKSDERYKIRIALVKSFQCIGKYLVFTNDSIKKCRDNFQSLASYSYGDYIRKPKKINTITIIDTVLGRCYDYDLTKFIKLYIKL